MPPVFGILIILHLFLTGFLMISNIRLGVLNKKWLALTPQRKTVEDFKKEHNLASDDKLALEQFINKKINWSEKLNILSSNLPYGIWFDEFSVTAGDFSLRALVISLEQQEMSLVNKFIENLKSNKEFFKDFDKLEVTSVTRRVIGGYDIIDFILTGTMKSK